MDEHVSPKGIKFVLDGAQVCSFPTVGARLSEMLREDLGSRDVKIGCNAR